MSVLYCHWRVGDGEYDRAFRLELPGSVAEDGTVGDLISVSLEPRWAQRAFRPGIPRQLLQRLPQRVGRLPGVSPAGDPGVAAL